MLTRFTARSGNTAEATIKTKGTAAAVSIDWRRPPTPNDIDEFNAAFKRELPNPEALVTVTSNGFTQRDERDAAAKRLPRGEN